jgi:hypothetical protein
VDRTVFVYLEYAYLQKVIKGTVGDHDVFCLLEVEHNPGGEEVEQVQVVNNQVDCVSSHYRIAIET